MKSRTYSLTTVDAMQAKLVKLHKTLCQDRDQCEELELHDARKRYDQQIQLVDEVLDTLMEGAE